MAALTRADFTLEPAEVVLKDGRTVRLRRLSALDRNAYLGLCAEQAAAVKGKPNGERLRALTIAGGELIARTAIDGAGVPLFANGEDAASSLSEELMDEIGEHAARLNGIGTATDPNA
jgi:hypothetical protein